MFARIIKVLVFLSKCALTITKKIIILLLIILITS